MLHLAIFSPGYIEKIFTGRKTMDGRFSKNRIAPFGMIEKGDLVLMKKSGGPIVGYFVAGDIISKEITNPHTVETLLKKYKRTLEIDDSFAQKKKQANYVTLIDITKPTKFRYPVIVKKSSLHGWVSLGGESQKQIQLF